MSVPLPNIKPEVVPKTSPRKHKEIQPSEVEGKEDKKLKDKNLEDTNLEDKSQEDKDQGTEKRFQGGLGWVRPTPKGFTVRQGGELTL